MRLACQSLTIIIGFTFEKTFKSDIQQSNNPHRPTLLKPMAEWAVMFAILLCFTSTTDFLHIVRKKSDEIERQQLAVGPADSGSS